MLKPIYTSERVMSYVYWGTHKITGQYYIGARMGNILENRFSHRDLGIRYFASSEYVDELGFENFDWIIFAEFFDPDDAFDFEDKLIDIHLYHPLNLNKHSTRHWNTIGLNPYRNKTPEEMTVINDKRSKSWHKNSEEIKREIINRRIKTLMDRSDEEKEITKILKREAWNNRSEEDNAIMMQNYKKTVSFRSEEYSAIVFKSRSDGQNNRSPEAKALTSQRKSDSTKGIPKSEKHSQNISKALTGLVKPKLVCTHCGKIVGGEGNLTRWHNDNCKLKNVLQNCFNI